MSYWTYKILKNVAGGMQEGGEKFAAQRPFPSEEQLRDFVINYLQRELGPLLEAADELRYNLWTEERAQKYDAAKKKLEGA